MTYKEIFQNIQAKQAFLCVGLDADRSLLPACVCDERDALLVFNREIIEATAPYAVAYKLNTAFYEAEGANGWAQLVDTVEFIRNYYPDMLIIADAKRGDIGNTAQRYAKAFLKEMDVDAVTLTPYMGMDSIQPFLKYKDKWSIVLALTSNDTASDFELQPLANGRLLYHEVIEKCCQRGTKEQMMFVVGATRPEELAEIRKMAPDYFLLVPGVGAQGGNLAEVAKYGMNNHCGLLVNASRDIIYASSGADFAQAAGNRAAEIAKEMSCLLNI